MSFSILLESGADARMADILNKTVDWMLLNIKCIFKGCGRIAEKYFPYEVMNTIESIYLREPCLQDEVNFLDTMQKSKDFHFPFVIAPQTSEDFQTYLLKFQKHNQKSYLALDHANNIIGVFNISEIVHGVFQSAYMGYYASVDFAGQGLMSYALKLVLKELFLTLKLHRIEANIQPTNTASIQLVMKNGFIKEGFSQRYLKTNGIWCDHFRFALTYEDWLANQ